MLFLEVAHMVWTSTAAKVTLSLDAAHSAPFSGMCSKSAELVAANVCKFRIAVIGMTVRQELEVVNDLVGVVVRRRWFVGNVESCRAVYRCISLLCRRLSRRVRADYMRSIV